MKEPDTSTVIHIRLRRGPGLPELMSVLEEVTPVAQALPPAAVITQVAAVSRLFGIGPMDLARRMRIQALEGARQLS